MGKQDSGEARDLAKVTVLSTQDEMPWCGSAEDCGRLNTRSGSRLMLCGHSGSLSFSESLSSLIKMGKAQLLPGVVCVCDVCVCVLPR